MDFLEFQRELNGRFFYRYNLRSESFTFKCQGAGIELVLPKTSIVAFELHKEENIIFLDLIDKKTLILGQEDIHFPFEGKNLFCEDDFNYSSSDDLRESLLKFVAKKEDMKEGEIFYQIEYLGAIIESAKKLGFKVDHYQYLTWLVTEAHCRGYPLRIS
jgi:hypothetical protein